MSGSREEYAKAGYVWALATLCAVHRRPFDAALLLKQFPPPYGQATLIQAARGLGFKAEGRTIEPASLARLPLPVLVELYPDEEPIGRAHV